MTAASVVGVTVVALGSLPLAAAVTDISYVSAALITIAVLLTRSGERQDELVTILGCEDSHAVLASAPAENSPTRPVPPRRR